jgi:structural maintenance of chromosome 4
MKPKGQGQGETGLLEYLEEIIGSSQHVEEIEELARSLEQDNETRHAHMNRVKASSTDL